MSASDATPSPTSGAPAPCSAACALLPCAGPCGWWLLASALAAMLTGAVTPPFSALTAAAFCLLSAPAMLRAWESVQRGHGILARIALRYAARHDQRPRWGSSTSVLPFRKSDKRCFHRLPGFFLCKAVRRLLTGPHAGGAEPSSPSDPQRRGLIGIGGAGTAAWRIGRAAPAAERGVRRSLRPGRPCAIRRRFVSRTFVALAPPAFYSHFCCSCISAFHSLALCSCAIRRRRCFLRSRTAVFVR